MKARMFSSGQGAFCDAAAKQPLCVSAWPVVKNPKTPIPARLKIRIVEISGFIGAILAQV